MAMAIECAHCGTRCEEGTTRCPRCLRTTHLVAIPEGAAAHPKAERRVLVGAVMILLLGGGAALLLARSGGDAPAPLSNAPAVATAPLAVGPGLAPVVARVRAERDALARARLAAEEVHRRRSGAAVVGEGEPVPPPREPDALWAALPVSGERVTTLDLARLAAAVLRAAGTPASVAERTAPSRPDEPADATGVAGSYVVRVGEHLVDAASGGLLAAGTVAHAALDETRVGAAVSAQAALAASAADTGRDRALAYANAAVAAWPGSPTPLAARAHVWRAVGATSGLSLADADLRAAIALRDDAPYHVARARVLMLQSRDEEATTEIARALRLAPAWGTAALAGVAFADALAQLDAGATRGCAGLRSSRAAWTDDAYALCAESTPAAARAQAAARLMAGAPDPLRLALAAAHGAAGLAARLRPADRREAALWLLHLGRPELARALVAPGDGGT